MISVKLYAFNKKRNSTLQPSAATVGVEYTGEFKEGASITAPVVTFNLAGLTPSVFTYAYIPEFSRYYFIDGWDFYGGLWTASMSVDVLASFKTKIGISTQYVLRSASSKDGNIIDNVYPVKTASSVVFADAQVWQPLLSSCWYVIGVLNKDSNTFGSVSYYAMSSASARSLFRALMETAESISYEEISEELAKAIIDPFKYITTVMWFPYSLNNTGVEVTEIPVGYFSLNINCFRLAYTSAYIRRTFNITLAKHPKANGVGAYLNFAPYSRYTLFAYPFGNLELPAECLKDISTLYGDVTVDLMNGQANLNIRYSSDGYLISSYFANVGVQVPIGQITANLNAIASTAQSAASAVGSVFSLDAGGVISNAASAISSAVGALSPVVSYNAGSGSATMYQSNSYFRLKQEFFDIVDTANSHLGSPLCANRQINTLSGYIMCSDADISISAFSDERDSIKQFMDGGFFYE